MSIRGRLAPSQRNLSSAKLEPPAPVSIAVLLSNLSLHAHSAPIDAIGKRKVDGDLADTRLGKVVTARWANERFRQCMMLIHEFRSEWPNQSLLSNDDVETIRMTLDVVLAAAERTGHVGDIYDMNPTTWSIWLVQHAYATLRGGWTVETEVMQRQWSFEALYRWLEVQHARGEQRNLYDPSTRQLLHRYRLPFKANMRVPPAKTDRFKYVKGARRLSGWMEMGGLTPLDRGIQDQLPPTLVAPPPLQSRREELRAALWSRVASRASNVRRMANVHEDSDDERLTREVVQSVMHESRKAAETTDDDDDEDWVRELERDMDRHEEPNVAPTQVDDAPSEEDMARLLEMVKTLERAE